MGGAIGTSALGAVLTARLAYELRHFLPTASPANGKNTVTQLIQSPATLDKLKTSNPALHEGIIQAYAHAIDRVFLVALPISILSVIAALFIRQERLRGSNTTSTDTAPRRAEPPRPIEDVRSLPEGGL
jgi:hypothetical protein